jgi:hypothetical protein
MFLYLLSSNTSHPDGIPGIILTEIRIKVSELKRACLYTRRNVIGEESNCYPVFELQIWPVFCELPFDISRKFDGGSYKVLQRSYTSKIN